MRGRENYYKREAPEREESVGNLPIEYRRSTRIAEEKYEKRE
jgi:hypothetical protein